MLYEFVMFQILIAAFALVYGNPKRLINGMDSFGNVCGTTNEKFGSLNFSGIDMTDKPYVFFLDPKNPHRSTAICVNACPQETMNGMTELQNYFFNTSISYCR
jgi:solute carrier family 44 protein 1 (choline transporter-like protein)